MLPCSKARQGLLLEVKGETPLGFVTQDSLIMITAKELASKAAARADLQVSLGTGHVFHLLDELPVSYCMLRHEDHVCNL